MSEKLKIGNIEAIKNASKRTEKLIHQPVSKKVVDLLIEDGKLEKAKKSEDKNKKVATPQNRDAEL